MIIQIVPTITNEADGVAASVLRLCDSLIRHGETLTLAVLDWQPGTPAPPYARSFPLGAGPRNLGRSPQMARWLLAQSEAGSVDLIHNHGLWMMPNVYSGWARRHGARRLVVSPHGTLSAWAFNHHALRKKIFWTLLQAQTLQRADCLHATAESEHEDLRRMGFRQPVCVLPNGIDVPAYEPKTRSERRRLLYLGRIHKIKGIDLLLHAWCAVQQRFADWDLVIAGPDGGGYLARMQALALQLGAQRVSFPGPLYGAAKLAAYRAASLYVLPTHSENFGMTVAEALAAGTPAVVTRGAPWPGLVPERAGWWVDANVAALTACLREALACPDETLAQMGRNGRAWMERDFSWSTIGREMSAVYRWLNGRGEKPSCVHTTSSASSFDRKPALDRIRGEL